MKKQAPHVFTTGYEQSGSDDFVRRLQASGIDLVVDVRAVALSRKPGFSKNRLRATLTAAGVEYRHILRLGAPAEVRDHLRVHKSWAQYERGYHAHLDGCEAEVTALLDLAAERAVCLLCFERDPAVCHRSLITGRMAERRPDLVVEHLRY